MRNGQFKVKNLSLYLWDIKTGLGVQDFHITPILLDLHQMTNLLNYLIEELEIAFTHLWNFRVQISFLLQIQIFKSLLKIFSVLKHFLLDLPQKIAFHPSDVCIAAAFTNKTIKLFDLRVNKQLQLYRCHENDVNSVEFHPSGNYLYSVSSDSTAKVHICCYIHQKNLHE